MFNMGSIIHNFHYPMLNSCADTKSQSHITYNFFRSMQKISRSFVACIANGIFLRNKLKTTNKSLFKSNTKKNAFFEIIIIILWFLPAVESFPIFMMGK